MWILRCAVVDLDDFHFYLDDFHFYLDINDFECAVDWRSHDGVQTGVVGLERHGDLRQRFAAVRVRRSPQPRA